MLVSFDKHNAHKMFGYRLWFDADEMKSYDKRGKPRTKSDLAPGCKMFKAKWWVKPSDELLDNFEADNGKAHKFFQENMQSKLDELSNKYIQFNGYKTKKFVKIKKEVKEDDSSESEFSELPSSPVKTKKAKAKKDKEYSKHQVPWVYHEIIKTENLDEV